MALARGHFEGGADQLGAEVRCHRPAVHPAAGGIHDHCRL